MRVWKVLTGHSGKHGHPDWNAAKHLEFELSKPRISIEMSMLVLIDCGFWVFSYENANLEVTHLYLYAFFPQKKVAFVVRHFPSHSIRLGRLISHSRMLRGLVSFNQRARLTMAKTPCTCSPVLCRTRYIMCFSARRFSGIPMRSRPYDWPMT